MELAPGGAAAFDYNNDGSIDIFFTNGAPSTGPKNASPAFHNRLFLNNCDMTYTDVTEPAGVAGEGYSIAVAADYDNDGFVDLFVAGVKGNILFHNRGNGTFGDVMAKAGVIGIDDQYGKMWGMSAARFDFDEDGWLDLFELGGLGCQAGAVLWPGESAHPLRSRSVCGPVEPVVPQQPQRNVHGRSRRIGLLEERRQGHGRGIRRFQSGRVAGCVRRQRHVRNFLLRTRGNGTFEEVELLKAVALGESGRPIAGMGVDFRDFDEDGAAGHRGDSIHQRHLLAVPQCGTAGFLR
jgi:hypothetical protein